MSSAPATPHDVKWGAGRLERRPRPLMQQGGNEHVMPRSTIKKRHRAANGGGGVGAQLFGHRFLLEIGGPAIEGSGRARQGGPRQWVSSNDRFAPDSAVQPMVAGLSEADVEATGPLGCCGSNSRPFRRGNQACDYILQACIQDAAELTAAIAAKRLVERLERSGFVIMQRLPATAARPGAIGIFPNDPYSPQTACRRPARILSRALSQSLAGRRVRGLV